MENIAHLLEIRSEIEREILKFFSEKIEQMPVENENIKRLGDNCYSMNISEVFKTPNLILSVEYYDFEQQKNKLLSIIGSSRSVETILQHFEEIISTGFLKEGTHKFLFHPEVVDFLKRLLSEEGVYRG